MVMSSSHIPDETPEPSQIRVSTHNAPYNSFSPDASSSWNPSDWSNVSLRKYFHHLSTEVHQPLYPILFSKGSSLAIVSNIFYCLPANTVCQHTQSNDTLQYPIWEGANHLISPSFDTLVVYSVHSLEFKESHLSSYHLSMFSQWIQSKIFSLIVVWSQPTITICTHILILWSYQYWMACCLKVQNLARTMRHFSVC